MMSKRVLARHGLELAAQLDKIRTNYPYGSDAHDILYFEAVTLRAKSSGLLMNSWEFVELPSPI